MKTCCVGSSYIWEHDTKVTGPLAGNVFIVVMYCHQCHQLQISDITSGGYTKSQTQKTMPMTNKRHLTPILRPFRVEIARKLLVEYHVERWLPFLAIDSALRRFLEESVDNSGGKVANKEFDVLAWWKANQGEYPILSRIAIDLYAIPGMSAEVERVFTGFVPLFL